MESNDKQEKIINIFRKLDAAWPFKRIVVPENLLRRWNAEHGVNSNRQLVNVAFTVSKDFEVTEESIWAMLNEQPKIVSSRISNPPNTGMKKRSLMDGLESL